MSKYTAKFAILVLASGLFLQSADANSDSQTVLLATTTSTENSGLIEYLLPELESDTGYQFKVIAVGTGKALKMGEAGDVDVLLVHSKSSELEFVESGFGLERVPVMYNDFVLVGPIADPADVTSSVTSEQVMKSIESSQSLFVSRGDDSGTYKKEQLLWNSAGLNPQGDWYLSVGQGMGKTLQIADEVGGYTLTDRGTWLFAQTNLKLDLLFEGGSQLHNQYSVIIVNPDRYDINYEGAIAFRNWMSSNKGQKMVDEYRINGQQLFHGNAD